MTPVVMTPVVAVIAPGMMGAAVGKRLVDHGLKVLTSLQGRSAETRERAKAAGMVAAISSSLAATMPAALARSRVSALRPCSEVSTLRP